jgi:rhomboid protease GluP
MRWNRARATLLLAFLMIVAFIFELISGALFENGTLTLSDMGAIVPGTLKRREFARLVAAIFLHGGILHLLLNLWAFVQIGYVWETLFGARRFLFVFFTTGIIASITSALFIKPPGAVGASGAIFGLVAAFVVVLLRTPGWRTAPWTRRLSGQLAIWALISIVMGFLSPRTDNAAHLGGIIGGLIIARLVPTTSLRMPTSDKINVKG